MPEAEFALRLLVGLLAGAAIGLEREFRQKMAGVRTNALVALGAAGFVASAALIGTPQDSRVAAQVVTGVGFLGGGVILREGFSVHGLNTAATLWCAAMVGTLAGIGHVVAAGVATLAVVGSNLALRPLVHRLDARLAARGRASGRTTVTLVCAEAAAPRLRQALLDRLRATGLPVESVESAREPNDDAIRLTVRVDGAGRAPAIETMLADFARDGGVRSTNWAEERIAPDS